MTLLFINRPYVDALCNENVLMSVDCRLEYVPAPESDRPWE